MTTVILIESYTYFRATVLIKLYVYYEFIYRVKTVTQLYLKTSEAYRVIEFLFTRKNLHLLEDQQFYISHSAVCLTFQSSRK